MLDSESTKKFDTSRFFAGSPGRDRSTATERPARFTPGHGDSMEKIQDEMPSSDSRLAANPRNSQYSSQSHEKPHENTGLEMHFGIKEESGRLFTGESVVSKGGK